MNQERIVLRMAQLSDLHIQKHRNLLEPMIDKINSEVLDIVVVTGDIVHERDKDLFKIAADCLNRIKHKVVVIPGDYDSGDLWKEHFGEPRSNIVLNGYCLDFLDTSFMKHRFEVGWGDVLRLEDKKQHDWLLECLEIDKYHFIFSHHPFWVTPREEGDQYLKENIRGIYSGHLHQVLRYYFKYNKPRAGFDSGFSTVPMKWHGNSCYLVSLVNEKDEIINVPRIISAKSTAW